MEKPVFVCGGWAWALGTQGLCLPCCLLWDDAGLICIVVVTS